MHGTRPTCLTPRFHAACLLDEAQAECVHQLANQDADHEVREVSPQGPGTAAGPISNRQDWDGQEADTKSNSLVKLALGGTVSCSDFPTPILWPENFVYCGRLLRRQYRLRAGGTLVQVDWEGPGGWFDMTTTAAEASQ
ncbi:hypothetical protein PG996_003204 [Apiospora saccharicola]|uniref:Uncharacterized protein n=1 Tax=Apiospora saccharicola TaxID=335842 RepID=A0ABR1W0K6_9PEZI